MYEWIKVKDRHPDINEWILAFHDDVDICKLKEDWRDSSKMVWEIYSAGCGCCQEDLKFEDITHWMPLPKSPKDI